MELHMNRRRILRHLLPIGLLAVSLCTPWLAHAAAATFPERTWRVAPPEVSLWSADALKQADEMARVMGTDAFLVVHHGVIVHQYGEVGKPMNMFSGRKSVLSVLYGIAVDRHTIDLDKTLSDIGIDDQDALTETEKTATIRQLLQARSGVYHPAAYETAAMKEVRPLRGSHTPGSFWYYNNWDFNVLGAIYQKFTSKDVFSALNDELAQPLQFEDFDKTRDTEFIYEDTTRYPAYVMQLSARDLARLGLLMAREGNWKDRQIVSKQWVDESTSAYSKVNPNLGYGYLWWVRMNGAHIGQNIPARVFLATGNHGQRLIVNRQRDLVIVHRVNASLVSKLFSTEPTDDQFNQLLQKILTAAPKEL